MHVRAAAEDVDRTVHLLLGAGRGAVRADGPVGLRGTEGVAQSLRCETCTSCFCCPAQGKVQELKSRQKATTANMLSDQHLCSVYSRKHEGRAYPLGRYPDLHRIKHRAQCHDVGIVLPELCGNTNESTRVIHNCLITSWIGEMHLQWNHNE